VAALTGATEGRTDGARCSANPRIRIAHATDPISVSRCMEVLKSSYRGSRLYAFTEIDGEERGEHQAKAMVRPPDTTL
jgi:hypothetical protein